MATAPALPLPDVDFEAMPAEKLLRWAYVEYGEKLCLSCSWQKQSSVLVHMVSELGLPIDVVELDTQLFFKESYETRDALVERYGLTLIQPDVLTIAEQHKHEGPRASLDQPRLLVGLGLGDPPHASIQAGPDREPDRRQEDDQKDCHHITPSQNAIA